MARYAIYYVGAVRVSEEMWMKHFNDPNNFQTLTIKYEQVDLERLCERIDALDNRVKDLEERNNKIDIDIEHLPLRCDRPIEPWYQTDTTNVN